MNDVALGRSDAGWGHILRMTWPASLTMLNTTLMKFVDGLMVSRVGPEPFAAQYAAGMASFVPESFMLGVLTVVNTYVGQSYGAGLRRRTGTYAWAGMVLAVAAGLLIAPLALVAGQVFRLFDLGPGVQAQAVMYYRYMVLTAAFPLTSRVLEQFFYGTHRPIVVLRVSVVANLFNVGANWVLIFGHFGLPAMGLQGAAIGTIAAWVVQFVLLMAVFFSPSVHEQFATRAVRTFRWRRCLELLRTGAPAGVQLCNDILIWTVFHARFVAVFGTAHLAATTIAMRYLGLSFMPAVGIGLATTAMVGKAIGEGRPDLARRRARSCLWVAMAYMGLCGLAFVLFRQPMVRWFVTQDPLHQQVESVSVDEIVRVGATVMLCAASFQLLDAVAIVYIGALRGAGDTLWPMAVTVLLSVVLVLGGGAFVVRFLPGLKSVGPWIAVGVYVAALGIAMAWRFGSGRWRKIDLLGRAGPKPIDLFIGDTEFAADIEPVNTDRPR